MSEKNTGIKALEGKILTEIIGARKNSEEICFVCNDGSKYYMSHIQNCCEIVSVEDICGDIGDLLNTPIISAQETGNIENDDGCREWTFYHIRTIKGTVTIRWYGVSNGYYSTSVDFRKDK